MRIPSVEKCHELMSEMEMMDHIVAHSVQVCRVAMFLVDLLKDKDMNLNVDLVRASALLHDITKTRSFKTGEDHALTGEQLLNDLGYPDVGRIVGQHVLLDEYFVSENPVEAEVVNYADKRVVHDKIVTIEERLDYILQRYGKEPERRQRIRAFWNKTEKLEDKLFSFLPFPPQDLESFLGPDDYYMDSVAQHSGLLK